MTSHTRTHSALKWLVNERAALAGELAEIERHLHLLQDKRAHTLTVLHSMDRTIVRFNPKLDPKRIRAIDATKERYGGRGKLRQTMLRLIAEAGPEGISSQLLAPLAIAELGLPLTARLQIDDWWAKRGRSAAKKLRDAGLVDGRPEDGRFTVWRAAACRL